MSECIVELDSKHSIALKLAFFEEMRGGDFIRGEIVRCRDCVGLVEEWGGWECERFSGEYHRAEPDGFCAWGERRENDD